LSTGNLANIEGHIDGGGVDFVEGDVRDVDLVARVMKDVDVVYHLAAITSVPFSVKNPDLTFDVNVGGTNNLLRSAADAGVVKFVFVSSCAVYGDPEYLPLDEKAKLNPISPYAASKLAGEKLCLDYVENRGFNSAVVRFFNVYGLRQGLSEYSGVITKFFDRARKGLPLLIYGDGLQTRDFVNVHDVVSALLSCMENSKAEGEIFNIGTGTPVSINELATTVLGLLGLDLEVRHERARKGEIIHSYGDIAKARKLLGYKPTVALADGLRVLLGEGVFVEEFRDE
jgi:UDP-glucose 4-epimerase